jgi:hypothetical protein
MNESPESTNSPELLDQVAALRRQSFILLLTLIVVSGTLTGFLYLQARHTRKDLEAIRPQAVQIIQAYTLNAPNIQNFVKQLAAFGATHPDFRPVLQKYGIPPATAAASAPAVAPKK